MPLPVACHVLLEPESARGRTPHMERTLKLAEANVAPGQGGLCKHGAQSPCTTACARFLFVAPPPREPVSNLNNYRVLWPYREVFMYLA